MCAFQNRLKSVKKIAYLVPGSTDNADINRLLAGKIQGIMRGSFVGRAIVAKYPEILGMTLSWKIRPDLVAADGENFAYPTNVHSGVGGLLNVLVTEDIMTQELSHLIVKHKLV